MVLFEPSGFLGASVLAVVFAIIAWLGVRAVRAFSRAVTDREDSLLDRTAASFLTHLAEVAVVIIVIILYAQLVPALSALGAALLASVSVISIVLGFAAQNTLGNLVSGFLIILYRPFEIGDEVIVNAPTGKETGVVESLTLGYTSLRTEDHRRIIIPNNIMATQVTVNLTRSDRRVLASVPVTIAATTDIDRARRIITEVAESHRDIEEVIAVPLTHVGRDALVLTLRALCPSGLTARRVEFDLNEQVKKRFDQEGIA